MSKKALGSPGSRIKKFGKASLLGAINPAVKLKFDYEGTRDDLKATGKAIKPDVPKEDPSVTAARDRQMLDLTKLDEEQNLRIKGLLAGSRGGRFFRGSPLLRTGAARGAGGSAGGANMFVPRTPSRGTSV